MEEQGLVKGTPWKAVLRFALPLMGANILQQLYNTVDMLVVGNFESQEALSAVGSCTYLIGLYLAVATGFSLGAGVLVSQAMGAADEHKMRKYAGTGMAVMLILGFCASVCAFVTNRLWLKNIVGVPDNIFELTMLYITVYSVGFVFQFMYNGAAAVLRAMGDSRSSLLFLAVTSAVNIALDIFLVAVLHLGVLGAAAATVVSQFISMVVSLCYMFRKYPVFRPERSCWRLDKKLARQILGTGLPMTAQQIIVSCGFMLLQHIANSFGEEMTASYTVACRLEIYMLIPLNSLTSAMATFAGQNLGAGKRQRVVDGVRQTTVLSLALAAMICTAGVIFTRPLISLFGISGQAVEYCTAHVSLVCADLFLAAVYHPFAGLYQGIGKGAVSMFMFAAELAGRVIFAYLLLGAFGPACCWLGEPFAFAASVLIAVGYFISGRWEKAFGVFEREKEMPRKRTMRLVRRN